MKCEYMLGQAECGGLLKAQFTRGNDECMPFAAWGCARAVQGQPHMSEKPGL